MKSQDGRDIGPLPLETFTASENPHPDTNELRIKSQPRAHQATVDRLVNAIRAFTQPETPDADRQESTAQESSRLWTEVLDALAEYDIATETKSTQELILEGIRRERLRQEIKWGRQDHTPLPWLAILVEEVGEIAKAILEGDTEGYVKETKQVAAVAVASLEAFRRNGGSGIESIVQAQMEKKTREKQESSETAEMLLKYPHSAEVPENIEEKDELDHIIEKLEKNQASSETEKNKDKKTWSPKTPEKVSKKPGSGETPENVAKKAESGDPEDWTREPFRIESFCETETYQVIYADGSYGPLIDWIDFHGLEAADFCGRKGLIPAEEMPRWASRDSDQ